MSAGFAAADVAVSGSARMGVVGAYNSETEKNATTFSSRVHASFSGSGTTDGGLAFGGSFDMHNAGDADDGTSGSTFISGAFGKISMGGVDSGDKAAVGQLSSVGYEGVGSGNTISYAADGGVFGTETGDDFDGTNGAKVLYTYSAGALTVNASTAQLSNGGANHEAFGLGAAYTTGAMTLAVGYGTNSLDGTGVYDGVTGTITDVSASVTYTMGATTMKAIYQDKSADVSDGSADLNLGSAVSMGASVAHTIDALTLTAFAVGTNITSDEFSLDVSVNRMGLGASYDLGGGASFAAGWVNADVLDAEATVVSQSAFDAGVNFSF
jgi:outer membrane protein OmpU